ncbi:MAG: aminomethyl-transferring glycine dehydrogenase subunit GcvPB, partial [bacterium]
NAAGTIDLEDLRKNLNQDTAALMLTNPNTLGIFEKDILKIADMVHDKGALLYMDGANLNALLGIARPGDMGFDVIHFNLHKTFSTPHGGGGPGSGPVGVTGKLLRFLPKPVIIKDGDTYILKHNCPDSIGRVHSFFGNFGVMVRAMAYIFGLGEQGLGAISENAVINANYLFYKIRDIFNFDYPGPYMHEFAANASRYKTHGVKALDIAKRLLDYGYYAPTIYFPLIVGEAMMIEPTETESREALDAFADTLKKIIKEIETNPDLVKNAPHNCPVKRVDDVKAARDLKVRW